jgi:hypothetical protein
VAVGTGESVPPSPFLFKDMVTIQFYKYTGRPRTVNKTLGESTDISGVLRDNFNMIKPVITIRKQDVSNFNYCFIPDFNRYYFIEEVTLQNKNEYEMQLSLDVLKTYETQILDATGRVTEQDNPYPYISNRETVYNRKPNFEKVPFTETGLLNETGGIIMVTLKGNDNETE